MKTSAGKMFFISSPLPPQNKPRSPKKNSTGIDHANPCTISYAEVTYCRDNTLDWGRTRRLAWDRTVSFIKPSVARQSS